MSQDGLIEVTLTGGPRDLSSPIRVPADAIDGHIIKIPHHNGYEHFVRDPEELLGAGSTVFHWTGRTKIAE